eukprot:g76919.t1
MRESGRRKLVAEPSPGLTTDCCNGILSETLIEVGNPAKRRNIARMASPSMDSCRFAAIRRDCSPVGIIS